MGAERCRRSERSVVVVVECRGAVWERSVVVDRSGALS